jgi:hypothetical protein
MDDFDISPSGLEGNWEGMATQEIWSKLTAAAKESGVKKDIIDRSGRVHFELTMVIHPTSTLTQFLLF